MKFLKNWFRKNRKDDGEEFKELLAFWYNLAKKKRKTLKVEYLVLQAANVGRLYESGKKCYTIEELKEKIEKIYND